MDWSFFHHPHATLDTHLLSFEAPLADQPSPGPVDLFHSSWRQPRMMIVAGTVWFSQQNRVWASRMEIQIRLFDFKVITCPRAPLPPVHRVLAESLSLDWILIWIFMRWTVLVRYVKCVYATGIKLIQLMVYFIPQVSSLVNSLSVRVCHQKPIGYGQN